MSTISQNAPAAGYPAALGPDDAPDDRVWGLPVSTWLHVGVIAALMVALFRVNLTRLWLKANPFTGLDANWSHSFFIPLIGLYYLYVHRDGLLSAPVRPLVFERVTRHRLIAGGAALAVGLLAWLLGKFALTDTLAILASVAGLGAAAWGLLVLGLGWGLGNLFFGLLVFAYGIWPGQNDYVTDLGMVFTLFGTVLTLGGWAVMRIAWFPIAFLLCAIPWPTPFYSWLASPLQELAARVAVKVLSMTGMFAVRSGTKIIMEGQGGVARTLNVAEACAGLRSLMTFFSLAAAMAFLSVRPFWQKVVITLSAIPIAIFCNVMRVAGQGLLDHYWSQQWSEGFAHGFAGLVMLIPAFFLILGVMWVLDHLLIEEADDKERLARAVSAAATAQPKVIAVPPRAAPAVVPMVKKIQPKPAPVAPQQQAPSAPAAAPPKSATPQQPQTPPPPAGGARVPPRPGLTPPRPNLTSRRPPPPAGHGNA